jgi:hypothetical protein
MMVMTDEIKLNISNYTVDQLMQIAKDDPQLLEQIRIFSENKVIENAPLASQRKLKGLQFKLNAIRSKHNNPLGCCIAISKMMTDSIHMLNDVFKGRMIAASQDKSAQVISINQPKKRENDNDTI